MLIKDHYLHDLVNQTNFNNIYYSEDYHEPWVSFHVGITNVQVIADPTGLILNTINTTPVQARVRVICDNLDDNLFIFFETQSKNFILDKTTIFNISSHIEEEIKIIYFPNNVEEEISNTIVLRTRNFPDIEINITGTNTFDSTPYFVINPKVISFTQHSDNSSYNETKYITISSRSLTANILVTLDNEWTNEMKNSWRWNDVYSQDHHTYYGLIKYSDFDPANDSEPLSLEIDKDNANNFKIPISVFPNYGYYNNEGDSLYYIQNDNYIKSTITIHSMNEQNPDFEDITITLNYSFQYTGPQV